jgi:hypothetical protein
MIIKIREQNDAGYNRVNKTVFNASAMNTV